MRRPPANRSGGNGWAILSCVAVAGAAWSISRARKHRPRGARQCGFEVLAENDMGETIVASPALSNGQIFLRGGKSTLFCVTKQAMTALLVAPSLIPSILPKFFAFKPDYVEPVFHDPFAAQRSTTLRHAREPPRESASKTPYAAGLMSLSSSWS